MKKKMLYGLAREAYNENRRLVAPLLGFPGLNLTGCTIKLAQQNCREHFKALKAIAEIYKPDVIFPLMDLSIEANALGRYTLFPKEEAATVVKDKFCLGDLTAFERVDISYDSRLLSYIETIKLVSIGFTDTILRGAYAIGPYTLAALIMGAEEAAISTILNPDELHQVCSFAAKNIQLYINLLIAAGAQLICILEPCGVMLGPDHFEEFSANYVSAININCHSSGVDSIYHICGNTMHLIEKMCETGVDALSLDSPGAGIDLPSVLESVPSDVVVIGNISPIGALLRGKPAEVESEVNNLLESVDAYPNFILSTGCDMPQETPVENIHSFIRAGKNYKIKDTLSIK